MGPGEERRTARAMKRDERQADRHSETRDGDGDHSRENLAAGDGLHVNPSVKMSELGLRPSSGSLPNSLSKTALASSIRRREPKSKEVLEPALLRGRSSMATMTRSIKTFGVPK